MIRRAARALAWLLGLVVTGIALRAAATGQLDPPPLGAGIGDWAARRDPVAISVALVRLIAEAAVWYVLAVSALHAASAALHLVGGHRLADAIAVPAVRRAVRAGLGLGLVAASSVGGRDPVTTDVRAGAPVAVPADHRGGTATMRPRVFDRPSPGVARMAPAPGTWTVVPGDSLWSIAAELLADAWQRSPTDAEVDPFWRALVERNRGRLVDPGDPDLIQPGQVLEVPPLPATPA